MRLRTVRRHVLHIHNASLNAMVMAAGPIHSPQRLKAGDRVTFQVAKEKATGKQRACNVELVERAAEKPHRGYVCVLKDDFGFVEEADRRRMVFFHTSDVTADRCADWPLACNRDEGWSVSV